MSIAGCDIAVSSGGRSSVARLMVHCSALVFLGILTGCHSTFVSRQPVCLPPPAPPEVPRELKKVSLPDYIIEPPDILTIDAINLVPKSPYRLRPLDGMTITVEGLGGDEPIDGEFVIPPVGEIKLGGSHGKVRVADLTIEEAEQRITENLKVRYRDPIVSISLSQIAANQPIAGEHLVAPDGKVNLGTYGRIRVAGMTVEQATLAIEAHLSRYLQDPEIALDVFGYNSKVFYVITQGAGLGDRVIILPIRGNETALDAIGQVEGLTQVSSTHIWIARPSFKELGLPQILPVDWAAITQEGDATTNYQVLPGDRIYVAEDRLVALDTLVGKFVAPIERLMGVTLLTTNAAQRVAFFKETAVFGGGGGGF